MDAKTPRSLRYRRLSKEELLPDLSEASEFEDLVQKLGTERHLDARDFKDEWLEDVWAVFTDLVAFGPLSRDSSEGALNAILRFHHAIFSAEQSIPAEGKFVLTDCAYVFFKNLPDALKFASRLHAVCFAINEYTVRRRASAGFHEMVVPRTTIAKGSVFVGVSEVDKDLDFAIGSSVVQAYYLEKGAFMGAVRVSATAEDWTGLPISGNRSPLERWRDAQVRTFEENEPDPELGTWDKLGLVHRGPAFFPWALASAHQTSSKPVRPAGRSERIKISASIRTVSQLWLDSFQSSEPKYTPDKDAAKHGLALARWALRLEQAIAKTQRPKPPSWRRFLVEREE